MPLTALTAPPCGPVVGITTEGVGLGLVVGLVEGLAVGTVAPAPSRTSTWSRGIDALATAVAPNSDAILPAPADAPAP